MFIFFVNTIPFELNETFVSQKLELLPEFIFNMTVVGVLNFKFIAKFIHLPERKNVFHSFYNMKSINKPASTFYRMRL